MNRGISFLILAVFALAFFATAIEAVPAPVTVNGKQYYKVDSTVPSEDTGNEVCAKVGLTCIGYTDKTTAACKQYHSSAATTSSSSGDDAGVYCNGPPQRNVCASKTNTCHTCPACSNTVDCGTAIGGLYREMYVECSTATKTTGTGLALPNHVLPLGAVSCPFTFSARNTQQFIAQVASLNTQLQGCSISLPSGASSLIGNGNIILDITMKTGRTSSFTVTITNKQITGITAGGSSCSQRITTSEATLDTILNSRNRAVAFANAYGSKQITVQGCTIWRKFTNFFVAPISRVIVQQTTPPPPPPPPTPNCGNVGEQCNNRACNTGICAAPYEQIPNSNRFAPYNYRCIDQADYNSYCIASGNTRSPWDCLTGPCR